MSDQSAAAADEPRDPASLPLGAPYRWLWTASTVSNLADGLFMVALPLVAVRFTRSPALISGLSFALTLPWLLFALHAGALADRLDRRSLMVSANLVRAALAAGAVAAVVLDAGSIWLLYGVALGIGVAETLYDTSAQSILPQVVRRGQLSRANGRLYGGQMVANEFVGPPLAGVLVTLGVALSFTVPGGLWLVAVATLLLVRGNFRVEHDGVTTLRTDIAEGLRFLWRHQLLRTLAVMTGAYNFAANAVFAIFVLYAVGADSAMRLAEPAYGVLLTSLAAGSLVGSVLADRIERWLGRSRCLIVSIVGAALPLGMPGVTAQPVLIGAALFLGGIAIVLFNVIAVSLRQTVTPDRLLGRVNSGYRLFAWGSRPLGAAAGGLLGEVLGLRPVFVIMAVVTLGLLLGMRVVTDEAMDAAERDVDEQA
ncbi:MAG: MFS transporter [Nitriliruptoraceae bacterium]